MPQHNHPQKPTVVSNQTPLHPGAVTLAEGPRELIAKYRSRKPLRRPSVRKGKQ